MLEFRISAVVGLLSKTARSTSHVTAGAGKNRRRRAVEDLKQEHRQYSTKNKVDINVPQPVLPSPRLVAKFENKDRFLRLLLELELLYKCMESKLPTYLTDNDWIKYTRMQSIIERCCYLHQIYESRKEIDEKDKLRWQRKESDHKEKHMFNTLHYFEREDFRRFTYELFGSRLLAAWRCSDPSPPLLVDCCFLSNFDFATKRAMTKQMQDLLLDNSIQRHPFPVVFVNYRTALDIAQNVVNSWLRKRCLRKYRPLNDENEDKAEKDNSDNENNVNGSENFCSVPFVPVVTSATARECLSNICPDEIAYINPKAEEYLPGPLIKYKAFVLCVTPDSKLSNSSFQAARAEQLNSFRLPVNQFLNLGKTPITMPLRITANIIRDVRAGGYSWREAFEKHIPYFDILAGNIYQNHDNDKNDLQVLEQWLSNAKRKGRRKRTHFHLYSREDRRAAQAAAALQSSM